MVLSNSFIIFLFGSTRINGSACTTGVFVSKKRGPNILPSAIPTSGPSLAPTSTIGRYNRSVPPG